MSRIRKLKGDLLFESGERGLNLAQKATWGGAATIFAQAITTVLGVVGTVVLARLLTPDDYGLIGMVMVILGFAQMFKDAGLSMATVQRDRISHDQISTLFWVNVLASIILGVCIIALSPLISKFYGRPELTPITAALSISFIISSVMIQHQALLNRHMWFGTLAIIQIATHFVTLVTTILFAIFGWRYWALIIGAITSSLVSTVMTLYFCPWFPGKIRRGTGVRDMLKFGGDLTGFNFINYFSRNLDNVIIGKFIGAYELGIYDKSYQLFMMPISQIRAPLNRIALPVLSTLNGQPARFIKYYTRLVDIMASISIPLTVYCAIEADFLIRFALGPQWLGVIPIFRILLIAGFLQAISGTAGLVQLSMGRTKQYLKWGMVGAVLFVSSFVIGLPFGIKGVAIAYVVANVIIFFPTLWYCFLGSPVTVGLVIKTVAVPTLISGIALIGALIIRHSIYIKGLSEHFMFLFIFTLIIIGINSQRKSMKETLRLLQLGR